jgi:hypothetical protein
MNARRRRLTLREDVSGGRSDKAGSHFTHARATLTASTTAASKSGKHHPKP